MDWNITESEITEVESLLLPADCHFEEDAIHVIKHWASIDVSACPGSGKTTVLLAKLKLLADRMPLEDGTGICVLSHTNIAVDEIKNKLSNVADVLLSYPNYVGTIQSFIDRFVTMPYIRDLVGHSVQVVDDKTYAQHIVHRITQPKYSALNYIVELNYKRGSTRYNNKTEYVKDLHINENGSLGIGIQKKPLAGSDKDSTKQFKKLIDDILKKDGFIRYHDAYIFAHKAIENLSNKYTSLFSQRFHYVFIDEYQDCDELQRSALNKLFDPLKCAVFHIGDSDQAIYNFTTKQNNDWMPSEGYLSIDSSSRYCQKIADVISPLRKGQIRIKSSLADEGLNPTLIIFDKENIKEVLPNFITLLEKNNLNDPNGTYKAIGHIKNSHVTGINIGSYWTKFGNTTSQETNNNYWGIIDSICLQLEYGKLYRAENLIRKLICRIFHYAGITNAKNGKEHTVSTLREAIKEKHYDIYSSTIINLTQLNLFTRASVNTIIRNLVDSLLSDLLSGNQSVFNTLPSYFMEEQINPSHPQSNQSTFIDPIRGRCIVFDSVHGVKGETHDATLYLETESRGASDISRVLCYYGIGKPGNLSDFSRKIMYVGMSRPRKLLCVAIQDATYQKSQDIFEHWDKIDIRKSNKK